MNYENASAVNAGQTPLTGKVCQTGASCTRITVAAVKDDRTAKCGICGIPMQLNGKLFPYR
jgi:hypothetical protein